MIRLAILLCGGLCSLTGAAAAQEGEEGPGPGSASACTRLVLRVDRTDVVVGDAVEVRLGVENLTDSSLGLLPSDFALEVRDGAGELDDEAFVVSGPTIEGVFPGEGGPEIFPGGEAVATWTLFSTDDALTQPAPATFVLDGRAAHSHDGLHVEAAVASIELEVHPRPVLFFDHYFPEGVHADNPFSVPIVEPVEAFPLGLAVRNVGFGAASDVAVRSARPRLVDVQDGRPVRLRVLGAELSLIHI